MAGGRGGKGSRAGERGARGKRQGSQAAENGAENLELIGILQRFEAAEVGSRCTVNFGDNSMHLLPPSPNKFVIFLLLRL